MIVLLDAGPLGLVTTRNKKNHNAINCTRWLQNLVASSITIGIPEISDYEVRRELIRAGKTSGVQRLDELKNIKGILYLPITTDILHKAADLWADSRKRGHITASDPALDGDVILAATAQVTSLTQADKTIVATTNVKHLTWFTSAKEWDKITVEECLNTELRILVEAKILAD